MPAARLAWLCSLLPLLAACGERDPANKDPTDDTGSEVQQDLDGDGYTEAEGDCDEANPTVNPGAQEICDDQDVDEDCDGVADNDDDDAQGETTWYGDGDGDGFGDAGDSIEACDQPDGFVSDDTDCDDGDDDVHPGAEEVPCSGVVESCTGSDGDWQVPDDFDTIQDAVDAASDGDAICVGPGSWAPGVVIDKPLSLLSIDGPDATTIGNSDFSNGQVMAIDDTREVWIRGFTLTHGNYVWGGALEISQSTDVTVSDCTLRDNLSTYGGGVYAVSSDGLLFEDVEFFANYGNFYGGAALLLSCGEVEFRDCTFEENLLVDSSEQCGGALTASDTELLRITEGSFRGNWAKDGGALCAYDTTLELSSVPFEENQAWGLGGAVYLAHEDEGHASGIDGCEFTGNTVDGGTDVGQGGALYIVSGVSGESLAITDSLFQGNEAELDGGAVYSTGFDDLSISGSDFEVNLAGANGAGILFDSGSEFDLTDSTLSGNSGGWEGGAVSILSSVRVEIESNDFEGNQAGYGAGIYVEYSEDTYVQDNTFTDNEASGRGGGLRLYESGPVIVSGNTYTGNQAEYGGGMAIWFSSDISLTDEVVQDNTASESGGGLHCHETDMTESDCTFTDNDPDQVYCSSCYGCSER